MKVIKDERTDCDFVCAALNMVFGKDFGFMSCAEYYRRHDLQYIQKHLYSTDYKDLLTIAKRK